MSTRSISGSTDQVSCIRPPIYLMRQPDRFILHLVAAGKRLPDISLVLSLITRVKTEKQPFFLYNIADFRSTGAVSGFKKQPGTLEKCRPHSSCISTPAKDHCEHTLLTLTWHIIIVEIWHWTSFQLSDYHHSCHYIFLAQGHSPSGRLLSQTIQYKVHVIISA